MSLIIRITEQRGWPPLCVQDKSKWSGAVTSNTATLLWRLTWPRHDLGSYLVISQGDGHIWSYHWVLVILPVWAMSLQLCSGHVISRVGLAAWCDVGGAAARVMFCTRHLGTKGSRDTSIGIGGNIIRQLSFLLSTRWPYLLTSH